MLLRSTRTPAAHSKDYLLLLIGPHCPRHPLLGPSIHSIRQVTITLLTGSLLRNWTSVRTGRGTKNCKSLKRLVFAHPSRTIPFNYSHLLKCVVNAVSIVLGVTAQVIYDFLKYGSEFLHFVPIVGLPEAAKILLRIWQSLRRVNVCIQYLISIVCH